MAGHLRHVLLPLWMTFWCLTLLSRSQTCFRLVIFCRLCHHHFVAKEPPAPLALLVVERHAGLIYAPRKTSNVLHLHLQALQAWSGVPVVPLAMGAGMMPLNTQMSRFDISRSNQTHTLSTFLPELHEWHKCKFYVQLSTPIAKPSYKILQNWHLLAMLFGCLRKDRPEPPWMHIKIPFRCNLLVVIRILCNNFRNSGKKFRWKVEQKQGA